MLQTPLPLDGGSSPRPRVNQERDQLLARVAQRAEEARAHFMAEAQGCVLRTLAEHGPLSGEGLTDACKAAGIVPGTDDRAFGPVLMQLARAGQIEKCGSVPRLKGNLTSGGNLWRLVR